MLIKNLKIQSRIFFDWLVSNKLTLNYKKTKFMLFAHKFISKRCLKKVNLNINKHNIQQVSVFKYLGVYLDNKLTWQEHVNYLKSKLAKITGMFYKMRYYTPRKVLMLVYHALVGSFLRYGIGAWGSCSSQLQTAQDKVIRALLFLSYDSDTNSGLSQLKILNVKNIYKHEVVKLIHSVHFKYCPSAFSNFFEMSSHTFPTRLRETSVFSLSKPRTELGKKSLKFSGVQKWFDLPSHLKDIQEPKKFNKNFKTAFI